MIRRATANRWVKTRGVYRKGQGMRDSLTVRTVFFVGLVVLTGCEQNFRVPDAGHPMSAAISQCGEQQGSPLKSIAEVIDRVNTLPHPLSGPCFVAGLARPMAVVATTGTVSAQPAGGPHDPRVFILSPGVVIAVVPNGEGSKAIELGEWASATRTLKAEIALPVAQPLPADEPFTRAEGSDSAGVTRCGFCHTNEARHGSIAHGYVSGAFRPLPIHEVKLKGLEAEHLACITNGEISERCDMFHALFDFGAITQGAFTDELETFGQ